MGALEKIKAATSLSEHNQAASEAYRDEIKTLRDKVTDLEKENRRLTEAHIGRENRLIGYVAKRNAQIVTLRRERDECDEANERVTSKNDALMEEREAWMRDLKEARETLKVAEETVVSLKIYRDCDRQQIEALRESVAYQKNAKLAERSGAEQHKDRADKAAAACAEMREALVAVQDRIGKYTENCGTCPVATQDIHRIAHNALLVFDSPGSKILGKLERRKPCSCGDEITHDGLCEVCASEIKKRVEDAEAGYRRLITIGEELVTERVDAEANRDRLQREVERFTGALEEAQAYFETEAPCHPRDECHCDMCEQWNQITEALDGVRASQTDAATEGGDPDK